MLEAARLERASRVLVALQRWQTAAGGAVCARVAAGWLRRAGRSKLSKPNPSTSSGEQDLGFTLAQQPVAHDTVVQDTWLLPSSLALLPVPCQAET